VKQKVKVPVHIKQEKNAMEDWIYAQNSEVRVGLDNKYAGLKMDTKGSTQLGVPEDCIGH
jgi:hypothetical protein